MDTTKTKVRLQLDPDELARLTTRIYHESGYSLDHDDPVIVQYLINKITLAQFTENMGLIMTHFSNSLLPNIGKAEERFEQKKAEFVEHLEGVHRESLQAMNKQYLNMVNGTLDKVGKTVAGEMESIIKYMRSEQRDMSKMMEQEHSKFRNTAERFEKFLWKAAWVVGGAIVISALAVALPRFFA